MGISPLFWMIKKYRCTQSFIGSPYTDIFYSLPVSVQAAFFTLFDILIKIFTAAMPITAITTKVK